MSIIIEEIVYNPIIQVDETIEEVIIEIAAMQMPATKESIGLGNVDNTSDLNKPISTAVSTALNSKLNIVDYNDRFKGVFLTLDALNLALPTANAGDSAQVNEVGATDVINYSWDAEENIWVQSGASGSGASNTDALPEGTSNLYFTTARVLATLINGVSFLIGTPIVSTDNILIALGKLQKQITDNNSNAVKNIIANTITGAPITGTTVKTVLFSALIPANSFKNGDFFNIKMSRVGKIGVSGILTQRIEINTVNNIMSATILASNITTPNLNLPISRIFSIEGNKLKGFSGGISATTDIANSTVAIAEFDFNPNIDNYIFVTGQLANATDSMFQSSFLLTN